MALAAEAAVSVAVALRGDGRVSLLNIEDRKTISDVITGSETHGRAEIVVAVAKRSDDYAAWRAYGTALLSISATLALHYAVPTLRSDWLIAVQVVFAAVFWGLCGLPIILRTLAPERAEQRAVHRQAMQTFVEKGIAQTAQRTGVLVLISELERRVEIVADQGIHAHVGVQGWQTHVDHIVQSIRDRRAADGICHVVRSIAAEIHKALPISTSNPNELPNQVLDVE